ncbi:helix-turn-helix domain-containing protein [Paenibacillus sp. FSL K6-2524]|uniref:helix-turn-helix domain-containing protein n=1 Tax=Paenibacillus sp. FSL K6-2524 TaxID=2954516 RepID=UPI0030F83358
MNTIYPDIMFPHIRSEICLFAPHTRTVDKGWICGRHVHHMMFEVLLVLDGVQTAILGASEYEQQAGDLIIVSPMQPHDFQVRQAEKVSFFTLHIHIEEPGLLHLIGAENQGFYPTDHPLNKTLVPYIRNLMDTLFERPDSKMSLLRGLYTILDELQNYMISGSNRFHPAYHSELSSRIAREIQSLVLRSDDAITLTEDNLTGDWLEGIARKLGISRRHCHRLFRESYGIPPQKYLMMLKQQEAMHMLVTSNDSIERIAHRIGYENVQSFSRQFTSWAGCTPGVFRKNNSSESFEFKN